MRKTVLLVLSIGVAVIVSGIMAGSLAQDKAGGADEKKGKGVEGKRDTVRDEVRGGIAFRPEKRTWTRIAGKVKVLNAYTLVYEDGTEVGLGGMMEAPELGQKGLIDGKFYPCGKEAAEFLQKMIGDRAVTCIVHRDNVDDKKMRGAFAFVGETSLDIEMVRNGWAISNHEGMDPFEIMARENKRGLWRGAFVVPGRWRSGDRLPGE
ncbi:MAG TPA: thermonuclease family protein [Gemmatales bacterium]|nr:thermonuclease family protein [Gemmatales bacterium]